MGFKISILPGKNSSKYDFFNDKNTDISLQNNFMFLRGKFILIIISTFSKKTEQLKFYSGHLCGN